MNSREDSPARWWWVAGAAVLAALYLGFGLDNLYGDYGPLPASAALCFACLAILLAGIACRVKAPRASGALISAGALPLLMAYWAPPLMIAGLAVAVGAMIEVARRSAVGPAARAGAVLGSVLLSFGAIVPMLGLGFTPVITPVVAIVLGTAAVTAGIVLLLLTRAPAVLPTGHQERPTLAA